MAHVDSYHRSRYARLGRDAVLPFVVGLVLVIAGAAFGFVAAAMTGSFAARPAAAALTASPTAAIDTTAVTIGVCRAPAEAANGAPDGGDRKPAFGFLVFEWDVAQGGTLPGFEPLPATACRLSLTSLDG